MSRSYKKQAIVKDRNKGMKSISKRKIRRKTKQRLHSSEDDILIPNERSLTNQYDVCDWKFINCDPKHKRK
jgi:hypothetical protein